MNFLLEMGVLERKKAAGIRPRHREGPNQHVLPVPILMPLACKNDPFLFDAWYAYGISVQLYDRKRADYSLCALHHVSYW